MVLTYDDLIWLHDNKISLRAVRDYKAAENERDHGGHGDAITLATFAAFIQPGHHVIPKNEVMNLVNQYFNIKACHLLCSDFTYAILRSADNVPFELKNKLIQEMEMAIKTHVESALSDKSTSFVLLESNAAHYPYDIGKSYLTGKVGKHHFTHDEVKAIVDCQQQYDDLKGAWLDNKKVEGVVSDAVGVVLNQIRELKKLDEIRVQKNCF